jgi:rRNA maturation RNase YbeY
MSKPSFHFEGCEAPSFFSGMLSRKWLEQVVAGYSYKINSLAFIFCRDEYLLQINRQYLQHDYYTDVITFDYTEGLKISGDVFISLDTVQSNAEEFKVTFEEELNRVIVHGVLHLMGLKDKSADEALLMRQHEEKALELLKTL